MMSKMKYLGVLAGCALATGSLCAATHMESFEGGTSGEAFASWTGGTVTNNNDYGYSAMAGYPIVTNHTKVLLVEGDTSYDATSGSYAGTPLVDMMVQASRTDEPLELPEGETGVHIAVAVDSNGYFNVYCKNKSNVEGWCQLSNKAYADGDWARVSLLFNYTVGRCQVRIDGEPMMTTNGYLTPESDRADNGGWYKLVTTTDSAVRSLKVVGCTAIDDVVISVDDPEYEYAVDSSAVTNGVSCAWLDAMGVSWDTTAKYDESKKADGTDMTVADKYKYCFSPFDDQGEEDFTVKSISTTDTVVTLALPKTVANGARKVVVDYGTNQFFTAETYSTTSEVTGNPNVTIPVPAPGGVTYYRLRATNKVSE